MLSQYVTEGVGVLARDKIKSLLQLKYHAIGDAAIELGGIPAISNAFVGFQRHLY